MAIGDGLGHKYKPRKQWSTRLRMLLTRDPGNLLRYGPSAPRYAERIWCRPESIGFVGLERKRELKWRRSSSARVLDEWPITSGDIVDPMVLVKFSSCYDHWVRGVPWEETAEYWHYRDKAIPHYDFESHHKTLDALYEQVRFEGRLRPKNELPGAHFREDDGVRVNVGPSGELVFCDGGTHRLAMARILELPWIPAQLGCVARGALPQLPELRRHPS